MSYRLSLAINLNLLNGFPLQSFTYTFTIKGLLVDSLCTSTTTDYVDDTHNVLIHGADCIINATWFLNLVRPPLDDRNA